MFLLSGLLGAIVGAMLTFGFNMWKFHRDERGARCDELCKAIWDAAQLSSEYWSKTFDASSNEQAVSEARILASQILIDGLYEDFKSYLRVADQAALDKSMVELVDALTGGKFTDPGRAVDLFRLGQSTQAAGLTIVSVRRVYRKSLPFNGLVTGFHENRRRQLDMPAGWPPQYRV